MTKAHLLLPALAIIGLGIYLSVSCHPTPLPTALPRPRLISPAPGACFAVQAPVTFQCSTGVSRCLSEIQASDDTSFAHPLLDIYTEDATLTASYFNGAGTKYWRARFTAESGTSGPWSAIGYFEVQ